METEKNECFPEELNKLKFAFESARGKGLSADKLKIEQNFIEYINMLKSFAKRYTVFITSADTPCGPMFSTEIAAELMKIGLKINLSGKNRRSYAAIIDTGELIYEKLSDSVVEPVEYECSIGDSSIMLESIGFKVPKNNNARIIIDGKNYSLCGRGLNFVVFDMVTKSLIDAVNFDTYSDNFPCLRSHVIIDGLLDYQKAHPEVSVLCFTFPMFPDSNLNDNEKYLLQNGVGRLAIMANPSNPNFVLNKYFSSSEEIIEVLTAPKSYIDINGVRRFEDVRGKCVNISGGHRVTIGQPKDYKRTIYIVGGCQTFGVGSSDKGTIASHLQRLFNELTPEQEVIVQNYGFYLSELSNSQRGEELTILKSLPVQYGDIILCDFGANSKIPCVNLAAAAKHPHNYGEVFYDTAHRTEDGNRMIADKLFERIKQENFFSGMQAEPLSNTVRAPKAGDGYFGLDSIAKKELKEYKNTLIELYNSMFNITVGAIVMNCNPFTLGHRYLIEYASAQVDHLI